MSDKKVWPKVFELKVLVSHVSQKHLEREELIFLSKGPLLVPDVNPKKSIVLCR